MEDSSEKQSRSTIRAKILCLQKLEAIVKGIEALNMGSRSNVQVALREAHFKKVVSKCILSALDYS